MTSRKFGLSSALLATLVMLSVGAQAQWWQRHPRYLHAMSDLRTAYWLIQHRENDDPLMNEEERRAALEVRAAYQELKNAAIMDEKDIADLPPADMNFYDHRGRLYHALDLLRDSHHDIMGEEEDPAAVGLRHRAMAHIDLAIRATQHAIQIWNF